MKVSLDDVTVIRSNRKLSIRITVQDKVPLLEQEILAQSKERNFETRVRKFKNNTTEVEFEFISEKKIQLQKLLEICNMFVNYINMCIVRANVLASLNHLIKDIDGTLMVMNCLCILHSNNNNEHSNDSNDSTTLKKETKDENKTEGI